MTFSATGRIAAFYLHAKMQVMASGYTEEILAQRGASLGSLTEQKLLSETAWVILSSGMNERVIRAKFPAVTNAFLGFHSAEEIVLNASRCLYQAMEVFGHAGKLKAIIGAAKHVADEGFDRVKARLGADPLGLLRGFGYVGPVTVMHLAKNLGLTVVKPDRHLSRLASWAGFSTASELCSTISTYIGERQDVVDAVLWRYATLRGTRHLLDA
jgi:hypothetical protein